MKFSELYKIDGDFSGETNSTLTIHEGVKEIQKNEGFANIKVLNLPKSLSKIGISAFEGCKSLKKINFHEDCCLTSIGHGAFKNCINLEEVVLPKKVRNIGNCAFMGCYALKNVVLSNNLVHIYRGAFRNCRSLESLIIPSKVKKIDDRILAGSTSMKELVIKGNVDYIKPCAFCLEQHESKGYSISFETDKKYPLSIISYAPSSKEVPDIDSLRVRDCDIRRLRTESIDYDLPESRTIIKNSLEDNSLTLKGLLSSAYLDELLSNFDLLVEYLYDDLKDITPDDFSRLKKHFSPENINNIYSVFNRFLALNANGNIASYISDILGAKAGYRENSRNDESQIVLTDLSLDVLKFSLEVCTSREEAFESAKSIVESEVPEASDDFINSLVDKYYKGADGNINEDVLDGDDSRSIFDRETQDILASKGGKSYEGISESKRNLFKKVLKG